jgi:plastocyanin
MQSNPVLRVAKATPSGDAQTGTVGQGLANPLQVIVTRDGQPAQGVTVAWTVAGPGAMVTPSPGTTGADGISGAQWTLGQAAGLQTAQASVSGASGTPVQFSATAQAGPAAALAKTSGDAQTGTVSQALPSPLVVTVTDQFGNPVGGTAVQWSVTGGGGSVNPASSTSNAQGQASTVWTLGATVGPNAAQAGASGVGGSLVGFLASAVAPPPIPTDITITVRSNFFDPAVDTVAAGGTVTWTWSSGIVPHSVTSTGPTSFTGDPAGAVASPHTYGPITFSTSGTYFYYCTVHGAPGNPPTGMAGTIVVR